MNSQNSKAAKLVPIAKQAGQIILKHYRTGVTPETKEDDSPVTIADQQSSVYIVAELRKLEPQTPIISEELPVPEFNDRKDWKRFWLVDPLDGTKEFLKQTGEFTVNIACIESGVPIIGMIYLPVDDLYYFAEQGMGAWKKKGNEEAKPIFSRPPNLNEPQKIVVSRSHDDEGLQRLLPNIEISEKITFGSAGKFGLLAEGIADLYPRMAPCKEWDVAAGDCIFRNSGKEGPRKSPLKYNKENLGVPNFVLGLDDAKR